MALQWMFSLNWEGDRNVHSHLFWSPCIRGLKHCNKARKKEIKKNFKHKDEKGKIKSKTASICTWHNCLHQKSWGIYKETTITHKWIY